MPFPLAAHQWFNTTAATSQCQVWSLCSDEKKKKKEIDVTGSIKYEVKQTQYNHM